MNNHPETGYEKFFIPSGANTTQLKGSVGNLQKGFIHSVCWSPNAAGKLNIYDHESANSNQVARVDTSNATGDHVYDMKMDRGIRLVTDASWTGGTITFL